jgi:hypothetical protein
MRKASILLAIVVPILFFPAIGFSQMLALDWENDYPASSNPMNTHIATDRSGNIYVAANTSDPAYTLIKYNSAGAQQWAFEGPPGSSAPTVGVIGIAIDAYGNVYLVSNNSLGVEIDAFNGSAYQLYHTQLTFGATYLDARVMTADVVGNVYIGGSTASPATANSYSFMTVCVNGGAMRWMSTYQATANKNSWVTGIVADGAGDVYVTGTGYGAHRIGAPPKALYRYDTTLDIITIKYDTAGHAVWTNTFNGGFGVDDDSYQITQDPSTANIYVTGSSYYSTGIVSDLIAYSAAGTPLWTATTSGAPFNQGVAVDPAGNIFTGGFTNNLGQNGFNVLKYTSTGSLSWSYSNPGLLVGNASEAVPFPMALDHQGNCYLASMSASFTGFNTVELSPSGQLVWSAAYLTPQVIGDDAIRVFTPLSRFGQIGNPRIIVAGSVFSTGFTTLQYENHPVGSAFRPDSLNGGTTGFPGEFTAGLSNYPNPFHSTTTILYTLPHNSHVSIQVSDQSGHPIATLFDGNQNAGSYTVPFAASRLSPGVYNYRIIATSPQGNFVQTKQMLIL